jgi:hypothetical protein
MLEALGLIPSIKKENEKESRGWLHHSSLNQSG